MARNSGGGKFKRMPWAVGALVLALSLLYLVQARTQEEGAKNIILLVGDAMGLADVTAARMFKNGPGGEPLAFETLPEVGYQRTYSANSTLTDSAAASSAWATGEKFANGEISFKTNEKRSVRTILEIAKERGKATGLVTTKTITDATPAAFGAHVFSRDFDILPGMNAGDSYGAQARLNAAFESLRRVPAAGGITAPLTSQANRACPALKTLIAPTTSAFSSKPHSTHSNRACVWRLSAET